MLDCSSKLAASQKSLKKVLDKLSPSELTGETFNVSEKAAKLRRAAVEIGQRLEYILEFKTDTDGTKVTLWQNNRNTTSQYNHTNHLNKV